MKATKQVIEQRARHHAALELLAKSINPSNTTPGLVLWRKLAKLERKASAVTVAYCNGTTTEGAVDRMCETVTAAVVKIFGGLPPQFHINRDPRGYALKLYSSDDGCQVATPFSLHCDWGRNQILAPEIN